MREYNEIDWNGKLEAVHEDGRVVPAWLITNDHTDFAPYRLSFDGWDYQWCKPDGESLAQGWRIRNAPQAAQEAAGAVSGGSVDSGASEPSEALWGAPIEVNGVRPEWLDGAVKFRVFSGRSEWEDDYDDRGIHPLSWRGINAIRLPADHPYYTATKAGFTYWPGGDEAPGDWDGGEVLGSNGLLYNQGGFNAFLIWRHDDTVEAKIIGYRKRQDRTEDLKAQNTVLRKHIGEMFSPAPHLATYDPELEVVVRKMTEGEARESLGEDSWGEVPVDRVIKVLRDIGIVGSEPTPLDAFLSQYPAADRETAELMVKAGWRK